MSKSYLGDVIGLELVGRNSSMDIDGEYQDDYLSRINQMYSLDRILGERKDGIIRGGGGPDLSHFTADSPLKNDEGERILGGILYISALFDIWRPEMIHIESLRDAKIKTPENYLEAVKAIRPAHSPSKRMANRGRLFGISVAQRGGFVLPTIYKNTVVVLPSQDFVEYCIGKNQ